MLYLVMAGRKKINWKKKIGWLGYMLLIPSLIANLFLFDNQKDQKSTYLIRGVIDGDTFVTEDYSIVRFLGVSAPELDYCGGVEAKEYLESELVGKRVTLEVLKRENGRQLAYVYLNGEMVNAMILKSGWFDYTGAEKKYGDLLKPNYYEAKEAKRGIFGPKCTQMENPDNPKCLIKGNIGQSSNNSGGKIYHFPGCWRYDDVIVEKDRGEEWFCSEKEAEQAGYVKSKNCYGKTFKVQP